MQSLGRVRGELFLTLVTLSCLNFKYASVLHMIMVSLCNIYICLPAHAPSFNYANRSIH